MRLRKRVYVAGPLSGGDTLSGEMQLANVRAAIAAGALLMEAGYAPYVPHLTYYWHERHPHSYEDWIALCLAWVAAADAVLRLPGASPGADREVVLARERGVPVYGCLAELLGGTPP